MSQLTTQEAERDAYLASVCASEPEDFEYPTKKIVRYLAQVTLTLLRLKTSFIQTRVTHTKVSCSTASMTTTAPTWMSG